MTTARFLFSLLAILLAQRAYLQTLPGAFQTSQSRVEALRASAVARYNADVKKLSGPNKKYLAAIYKERFELVDALLAGSETVTDSEAEAYLKKLADEIFSANPSLPKEEMRILFSSSPVPNAFSMGEGTIIIHIGLVHRLQSESAVAFALCHEMAHYLLDHGNEDLHRYVNTVYSDAFQAQLKAISKTEYGRNQQLTNLAQQLTFRTRRHSRRHEDAADSMALELMKGTRFHPEGALHCLAMLDTTGAEKWDHPLDLERRFNFEAYPFKKSWTSGGSLLFAKEEVKEEEDSLSTHPDCSIRMQKLRGPVQAITGSKTHFITSAETFASISQRFDKALLQSSIDGKNLSRALYFALQQSIETPHDVTTHIAIGKALNEIYEKQKAHQLGSYIDLPGRDLPARYNELLQFLQNLRLTELASITYYYLKQYETGFGSNPLFAEVFAKSRNHFIN